MLYCVHNLNQGMQMKTTYDQLKRFAASQGLCVAKYNPGNNLNIKVFEGPDQDYFSGDGLGRFKTTREAYAFVQGWMSHKLRSSSLIVIFVDESETPSK